MLNLPTSIYRTFHFWLFLVFLSACNLNPSEINEHAIEEPLIFNGIPILILDTDFEVNPFQRVNFSLKEITNEKSKQTKPYFGKIKIRLGDHPDEQKKPSFSISLREDKGLAGMALAKEWILSSSGFDQTYLKDRLGYYLFSKMDESIITPKTNLVNLYLNGINAGLYLLKERLDEKRLEIELRDQNAAIFKEPEIFILEGKLFNQKYPISGTSDKSLDMIKIQRLIFDKTDIEFVDPSNGIFSILQEENIINWYLLLLLANDQMGMTKNFYIYRQNESSKYLLTIWDMENGFGKTWDGQIISDTTVPQPNQLFERLSEIDQFEFEAQTARRWQYLRDNNIIDGSTISLWIDEKHNELVRHQKDLSTKADLENLDNKKEIDYLKNWMSKRIEFLDKMFFPEKI